MPTTTITHSDADWAGFRDTRPSTTGARITIGAHSMKGQSKTQSSVALSPGQSELYASLKASAETLGLLSLLKGLGRKFNGEVLGDANAALGIINRNGLGNIRHIQTGLLCIQQVAAEQRLKVLNVLGTNNLADFIIVYLDEKTNVHDIAIPGYRVRRRKTLRCPHNYTPSVCFSTGANQVGIISIGNGSSTCGGINEVRVDNAMQVRARVMSIQCVDDEDERDPCGRCLGGTHGR